MGKPSIEAARRAADEDEDGYGIRKIFRRWDVNGDGSITRQELTRVLTEISPMTERDVDRLMQEADINHNGLIEYDEFVDWLMKPPAKSQVRAMLDYQSVLRPLFDIYDRNGNGSISFDEFEECHGILSSVLRRSSRGAGDEAVAEDPLDLRLDAQQAFKEADATQDGQVSFRDFVEWMKEHLDRIGNFEAAHDGLEGITGQLARMLQQVFKLQQVQSVNPLRKNFPLTGDEEETQKVYDRVLENLAKTTLSFGEALEALAAEVQVPADVSMNTWTAPPAGLSVERLRGMHMRLHPLRPVDVEDVAFEVLCLPSAAGPREGPKRRWFGEVVRKVRYCEAGDQPARGSKRGLDVQVDRPVHYVYEPSSLRWALLDNPAEFEEALRCTPPELLLFCLLKTEANMGLRVRWPGVAAALKAAVSLDVLSWADVDKFDQAVQEEALADVRAERRSAGASQASPKSDRRAALDFLERALELDPRHVMTILCKLGIFQATPAWKDFMT